MPNPQTANKRRGQRRQGPRGRAGDQKRNQGERNGVGDRAAGEARGVDARTVRLEAWVEVVMRTLATLGLETVLTELDEARGADYEPGEITAQDPGAERVATHRHPRGMCGPDGRGAGVRGRAGC